MPIFLLFFLFNVLVFLKASQVEVAENTKRLHDILAYLMDIVITLDSFLDIVPSASSHFFSKASPFEFVHTFTLWYEVYLEVLHQCYRQTGPSSSSNQVNNAINVMKTHILNMIKILFDNYFFDYLLNQKNPNRFCPPLFDSNHQLIYQYLRNTRADQLMDLLTSMVTLSSEYRTQRKISLSMV